MHSLLPLLAIAATCEPPSPHRSPHRECEASRSPVPPPQHAQRAQSIPAARRAEAFKLEIRLPFVRVFERPAPVLALPAADDVDCLGQARVARRIDGLEVVECAEDVVMPSGRKRKASECGLDDFAGTVGAKEPVYQEELPAELLRGPHFPDFASTVQFVAPQALEYAYRRVHRSVGCA